MAEHSSRPVSADNYFAIIPEWVLDSEISANAVRLYCVFRRYADQNGYCFPSRKTLARRCRVSEATVDRLIKELEAIGALTVRNRRTETGEYKSSEYVVVSVRGGVYSQTSTGVLTDEDTGVLTSDDITKAIVNESQELELLPTGTVGEKTATSDFDLFWGRYPRKVGKAKALKVWLRLSRADRDAALGALDAHVVQWRGKELTFVPHATSWLNGRRWEDELDVVSPVQRSRSAPGMGVLRHIMSYNNEQGELQ